MNYKRKGKKIVLILLIVGAVATAIGWLVMLLWNWLVPDLFNGPKITFWQALGLFLLSKLFFGISGRKGGGHWKHKWKHKMASMSPDERERFKERFMCKWDKTPNPTPENVKEETHK
ncbi:hypothetical protein JMN32_02990 [Fulvivirga sp. 29W222]|uniref:DUF1682 domain-containing protein n=1 Tax=Fulvivirga marina TaxID=2494733 RepID=A0A937FUK0_9BACT|nr:hypothetical protein [Fulvivirga marina]MBL6445258.1 hypothetical protein [Fulvivirga marina]